MPFLNLIHVKDTKAVNLLLIWYINRPLQFESPTSCGDTGCQRGIETPFNFQFSR